MADKFNSITWGGGSSHKYPAGIIGGAMADGSLMLWNADVLLKSDKTNMSHENALILNMDLYPENGSFYCLEFNQFQPNLLATGGDQCYIVDIESD